MMFVLILPVWVSAAQNLDVSIVSITSITRDPTEDHGSRFRLDAQVEVANPTKNNYRFSHSILCEFILIIEYHEHDDWTSDDKMPCDLGLAWDTIEPGSNNLTGHGIITFDDQTLGQLPDGAYTISFSRRFLDIPDLDGEKPKEFDYEFITHDYQFSMENGEIVLPRFVLNTSPLGLLAPALLVIIYRKRR